MARNALSILFLALVSSTTCVSAGNGTNIFGIGLIDQGSQSELDFAHGLGGDNGWVLLLFAGIDNTTTTAQPAWISSLEMAYKEPLQPVLRLSPPWGQSHYRDEADAGSNHTSYKTLGKSFAAVVSSLLSVVPSDAKLYVQIENEVNLGYEWFCEEPGSPLHYTEVAAEVAAFFRDVAAAIKGLGDSRVLISPPPMAPGGLVTYGCCGQENCPGDAGGALGVDFQNAMKAAVPNVFDAADFLATHSYPASGRGYGFNAPLPQAGPGLMYYELELQVFGRDLPVIVTETGWSRHATGEPPASATQQATWTVGAYDAYWLNDSRIIGVTPFMLQGPTWGDQYGFGWVDMNGNVEPVYSQVQALRCQRGFGPC